MIPGSVEDAKATATFLKKKSCSYLILDGYYFNEQYIEFLKSENIKIILFDDYGQLSTYKVDLIINRGVFANQKLYENRQEYTHLLLGPKYMILRDEFMKFRGGYQKKISDVPTNILISLGGSDFYNITEQLIDSLSQIDLINGRNLMVVIGVNYSYKDKLLDYVRNKDYIQVIENSSTMSDLMHWADFAITAGGTTLFEMAFMGLPSIVIKTAENQKSSQILAKKYKTCIFLGDAKQLNHEKLKHAIYKIENKNFRQILSKNGRELIDGYGNERIMQKLLLSINQFKGE